MSKEHDSYGFGEVFRMAAVVFLGIMTAFYPENTAPARWAKKKKKQLQGK